MSRFDCARCDFRPVLDSEEPAEQQLAEHAAETGHGLSVAPTRIMGEAEGCLRTVRPLTHRLDCGERGLAVQATQTCSFEGCDRTNLRARGLCSRHYQRAAATGALDRYALTGPKMPLDEVVRHYLSCPVYRGGNAVVAGQMRVDPTTASRWVQEARKRGLLSSAEPSGCVLRDCDREQKVRGLCHMHYTRWQRKGVVGTATSSDDITSFERFWAKVDTSGECWLWQGYRTPFGHGQGVGPDGRVQYAHRLAYEVAHGEIPAEMVVRHRCDVPACVRPSHLELGTEEENRRDMWERGRAFWQRREAV